MLSRLRYVLFCLVVCTLSARAELTIEITEGTPSALPIAVVPFGWLGEEAISDDIAGIVSADLSRSGVFKSLNRDDMLSLPSKSEDVLYRDWRILKQDYLLIGHIDKDPASAQLSINFELIDVYKEQSVLTHQLTAPPQKLRAAAHYISDYIYKHITKKPSSFSTKLLYVTANRERNKFELRLADADGHGEQVIYRSTASIISPSWAPDASKIAYTSFESGRSAIYIQDLETGRRETIAAFKGSNSSPAFSPDGRYLAMVLSKDGNPEIYVMELATKKLRRITKHFSIDTEPTWTPDSKSILFTSNRGGKPQIYRMDVQGGRSIKRVTFEGSYNARALVSSDGRFLAMVHRNEGRFHIAAQDLERGDVRILTRDTTLDESPSMSPSGDMLIYATKSGGKAILSAVSIDGQVKYRLPSTFGDVREPAWSPYINTFK